MATFLDPRFKCHFSDDTDVADIKETLQDGGKVIECILTPQSSTTELQGSSSSSAVEGPPPTKKSNLGSLFKDTAEETR